MLTGTRVMLFLCGAADSVAVPSLCTLAAKDRPSLPTPSLFGYTERSLFRSVDGILSCMP